jgi:hypothetical protein
MGSFVEMLKNKECWEDKGPTYVVSSSVVVMVVEVSVFVSVIDTSDVVVVVSVMYISEVVVFVTVMYISSILVVVFLTIMSLRPLNVLRLYGTYISVVVKL